LAGVSVGAHYGGPVKELILQLKFHRLRAAVVMGADLVEATRRQWPEITVVTSVPVAAARYRERGYNQSELLARMVAKRCGLPYSPLLGRLTSTHQIGLDRRSRLEQVSGAFYASKRLQGQHVLVVDDVVTTGATLSECAAVLTAAGAGSVWGAAVARH
jgi:ComF family protein